MPAQSDGASIVLQAWAMLHGNPLLHGWYLADVSFYTTELPEYMLVVAFRGITPGVVHICAALTYTLLVLLAAFVARGSARGRAGLVRAGIAVAIMLGPSLAVAGTLLNDPDHTGTAVPVLAVFALIDQGGRRWFVPAGVGLVLAWALVGDPLVLLIGVLPVLLVYGARAGQLLLQQRVPLSAARHELSLAAAAVLAVAAATIATHLIRASGGYVVNRGAKEFVQVGDMPRNAWAALEQFLGVFSANFFGHRFGNGLAFTAIHLVAAALVAAALWQALRGFFRADPVVPMLAVAVIADLAAYTVIFQVSQETNREVAPVFALGAALAGRVFAGPLIRNRLEPLLVVGLAAAVWAMSPGVLLAEPSPPAASALASWLERHHLREGIAGYWQAYSVTADSGGSVTMRAIREYPKPGLETYPWELNVALLDSRRYDVNFLVATPPGSQAGATVTEQEGIAKFGRPAHVYRYQGYVIMVWRKNLLPELMRR